MNCASALFEPGQRARQTRQSATRQLGGAGAKSIRPSLSPSASLRQRREVELRQRADRAQHFVRPSRSDPFPAHPVPANWAARRATRRSACAAKSRGSRLALSPLHLAPVPRRLAQIPGMPPHRPSGAPFDAAPISRAKAVASRALAPPALASPPHATRDRALAPPRRAPAGCGGRRGRGRTRRGHLLWRGDRAFMYSGKPTYHL